MTLHLRYVAHSEIGLVRKNNQDSCYASPTMLIVADGMGGAAAGDLASSVVIREMKLTDVGHIGTDMLAALTGAVTRATDSIAELIAADPNLDGMGSTATGVMFDGTELGVVNIGDSRTYLLRDGELRRLTHDHSWVQTLVDEGRLSEEESLLHPHRSLILRVINGQPQHTPDLQMEPLLEGDRLLICSDGLCGLVTDEIIGQHLDGPLDEVLKDLVSVAHEEGGLDNITIIIADAVSELDDEPAQIPLLLGAAEQLNLDVPLDTVTLTDPPQSAPVDNADKPEDPPKFGELSDTEHARYAPTTRHRFGTRVKLTLTIIIVLALVGFGGWAGYAYTQQQYYVGTNGETVALYQGIPDPVFNLPLSSVAHQSETRVSDLPTYYQQYVQSSPHAASFDDGMRMLTSLQEKARECILGRFSSNPPEGCR